jgi:hypothetical protein
MDAIQAIVDAALEVVRQRRGETPSSGDAGDPLERLVQAVEAYEQQQAEPRDAAPPLPVSLRTHRTAMQCRSRWRWPCCR